MKPKDNIVHVRVPEEVLDLYKPGPIRILQKLMYKHVWFADHLIKKFNHTEFAAECNISRMHLSRELEYLRKHRLIIKVDPDSDLEFINPQYCYRCTEGMRLSLIRELGSGRPVEIEDEEPTPQPSPVVVQEEMKAITTFDFSKIAAASVYNAEKFKEFETLEYAN